MLNFLPCYQDIAWSLLSQHAKPCGEKLGCVFTETMDANPFANGCLFCAPSVHSGSAWRLCWRILGSGGMRCWAALSPLPAAQTLLGGNSQAGPQQRQSRLGFSIIKYISASLGQSWNSHWISDVSLTCWIVVFSWIFFFVSILQEKGLWTPFWLASYAQCLSLCTEGLCCLPWPRETLFSSEGCRLKFLALTHLTKW